MPVISELLKVCANLFAICGIICLIMCGSTLSNPLDFFEFAFFTMLIISSECVGVQKKFDAFFFINCVGSLHVCVKFTLRR